MKRARRGRRCARLLNLIGNWEEEEYCRSYLTALGGGVRRFDGLNIVISLWMNSPVAAMHRCILCMAICRKVEPERFG